MATPTSDADRIHDLVQTINTEQAATDRETTIVQTDDS